MPDVRQAALAPDPQFRRRPRGPWSSGSRRSMAVGARGRRTRALWATPAADPANRRGCPEEAAWDWRNAPVGASALQRSAWSSGRRGANHRPDGGVDAAPGTGNRAHVGRKPCQGRSADLPRPKAPQGPVTKAPPERRSAEEASAHCIHPPGRSWHLAAAVFSAYAVRDDADCARHRDHVPGNPVEHGHVSRVNGGRYSTFHRRENAGVHRQGWAGDGVADGSAHAG
jgi:hypothetical protein